MVGVGNGSYNTMETYCVLYHWAKYWIFKQKLQGKGINITRFELDWNDMIEQYSKNKFFRQGISRIGVTNVRE